MGVSARQNDVLKVVRPSRRVEIFREPITAGELMSKYPRHCIARPDFFKFPWIVVHPESVLVPGQMFYLVPHHTMDNLLKGKSPPKSSKLSPHQTSQNCSPIKSLAGVTQKHQQHDRYYKGHPYHHRNVNDQEYCEDTKGQVSGPGSLYKLEFYKCWNEVSRNLNQPRESCYNQLYSGLDSSTFDSSRPSVSMMRVGCPHGTSPENSDLLRLKPCLRKLDSARRDIKLKVSFASPVVIPSSRRGSPGDQHSVAYALNRTFG